MGKTLHENHHETKRETKRKRTNSEQAEINGGVSLFFILVLLDRHGKKERSPFDTFRLSLTCCSQAISKAKRTEKTCLSLESLQYGTDNVTLYAPDKDLPQRSIPASIDFVRLDDAPQEKDNWLRRAAKEVLSVAVETAVDIITSYCTRPFPIPTK